MSAAETPEFAALVVELDDPYPILTEIAETTEESPPCIDEAHVSDDSDGKPALK